jgi:hypothetical protein
MWTFIKVIILIACVIYQFFMVVHAEGLAKESGDYSQAIYELIWLFMLFYVGDSIMEDDSK